MGYRFTPKRKHASTRRELRRAILWTLAWLAVLLLAIWAGVKGRQ